MPASRTLSIAQKMMNMQLCLMMLDENTFFTYQKITESLSPTKTPMFDLN